MRKFAAIGLLAWAAVGCSGEDPAELELPPHENALAALESGDLKLARAEALKVSQDDPDWADAQVLLGQIELESGNVGSALAYFRSVPRDGSKASLKAAYAAAPNEESLGQLSRAIASYEYILEHEPGQTAVIDRVSELYYLIGQRWKADRHLSKLLKTPDLGFKHLVLLTDFERRNSADWQRLKDFEKKSPDDPAIQLGLAKEDFTRGQLKSARTRLEAAVKADPKEGAAWGLLGEILLLEGNREELAEWYRQLPESVQNDPAIWYARGLWAEELDEHAVAARCFWESARETPTSYRAIHQVGRVLSELDPATGKKFAQQGEDLHQLQRLLSKVLDSYGNDEAALQSMIEKLLDSGREWEAWSWAVMAQEKNPRSTWVQKVLSRLSEYPNSSAARILDSANLIKQHDLSHYPDFASLESQILAKRSDPVKAAPGGPIQFADDAEDLGLEFAYHRGRIAKAAGVRMQESTGGGVGVLDFDHDGRPDLFLTQGEDWPHGAETPAGSPKYRDVLYQNVGNQFMDVTGKAGIPEEDGFGQGCASGDYNNDGFIDLYVANIGQNQLLLNNGDGTFTDATLAAGISAKSWTSSCVIADLNADGNPELFDVNYVQGAGLFQKICNETQCTPGAYDDSPDMVHVSLGDGRFQSVEITPGNRAGAGLGVIAFRSIGPVSQDTKKPDEESPAKSPSGLSTRLSLFIANDQDPNFFLQSLPKDEPPGFELIDESFLVGLAMNRDGRTTACMGVAAGDVTDDGRLDFFITNFKDEANTFYVQGEGGLFMDSISGSDLLLPGLPYVGWGTQFFDPDNDSRLDIVVANGHVGDFEKEGVQYRMPTQLFQNQGDGRFEELSPKSTGEFFEKNRFGRAVATLDWNRDGLADFVLSPLDENVALLTNRTKVAGHFVSFRLQGTTSARDAVGAVVTVVTENKTIRHQLVAGDGYQASNERILRIGLGEQASIREVAIEWPNGQTDTFGSLPVDTHFLVSEGGPCLAAPSGNP
jgi:tetratricopeptide (TPR) repeat protein